MSTNSTTVYYPLTSYSARYTFSAKEKDEETGYSVTSLRSVSSLQFGNVRTSSHCPHLLRRFGARYYNSTLSVWLSVDPMADKYPSLSSYAYCANNPVKLVDPDGRDWYENENGKVIWNDNVTKKTGAPKGGTYIGANDQDIVKYYGFNPQRQSQTSSTKGMVCIGEEGYHLTSAKTTTTLTTKAIVKTDNNAISKTNSLGKVFMGISITADVTTLSIGSSEGGVRIQGGLSVEYGGKTHPAGLANDMRAGISIPGSINQTATVKIEAWQLSRNSTVGAIQVSGSYGINGSDGQYRPIVIHALFPFPRTFKHQY